MFWTENNSQILLFEAGVFTMSIRASPDTHATSEIEFFFLKKKATYHLLGHRYIYIHTLWVREFAKKKMKKLLY